MSMRSKASQPVKFFKMPAISVVPVLSLIAARNFEWLMIMLTISVICIAILTWLSSKGMRLDGLGRKVRCYFAGGARFPRPYWRRHL